MIRRYLLAAALIVPLAPAIAVAQSAFPDPAVPGSGYQISEVHTNAHPTTSALPGGGYRIPEVRVARPPVLSADAADPSVPGDGYQIPE